MSEISSDALQLVSESPDQTATLGTRLGGLLQPGDCVCLSGDLGAGKTAFARGMGAGWGALEAVNSPTFVFSHEHHRAHDDTCLIHVDCYRLGSIADADSIGIEDILSGEHVAVLEWPERLLSLLPADHLWIELSAAVDAQDTIRTLSLHATGSRSARLLSDFRQAGTP